MTRYQHPFLISLCGVFYILLCSEASTPCRRVRDCCQIPFWEPQSSDSPMMSSPLGHETPIVAVNKPMNFSLSFCAINITHWRCLLCCAWSIISTTVSLHHHYCSKENCNLLHVSPHPHGPTIKNTVPPHSPPLWHLNPYTHFPVHTSVSLHLNGLTMSPPNFITLSIFKQP